MSGNLVKFRLQLARTACAADDPLQLANERRAEAMAVYGVIHQVADFVARSVSKEKAPFAHEIIDFLKAMSAIQESNALITMAVQTGDGLRIVYEGHFLSLIVPQQRHVRVLARATTKEGLNLRAFLDMLVMGGQAQYVESGDYDFWRVLPGSLEELAGYFGRLKAALKSEEEIRGGHPRTFPGTAREAALEAFEQGGGWCPGFGSRKSHKVDQSCEQIVFDHILPFARGGASSEINIQVMCSKCNAQKGATALGNAAR